MGIKYCPKCHDGVINTDNGICIQCGFEPRKTSHIQEYVDKIIAFSFDCANVICRMEDNDISSEGKKTRDEKWFKVLLEIIYFYIHLTDRFAFGLWDEETRDSVMTDIVEGTIPIVAEQICQEWPEEMVDKIKQECMDNFVNAMKEYGSYQKLSAKKDEDLKDTLFWEFGKNVANLTEEWPNPASIIRIEGIVTISLKELDINSFIEKAR
ncbi:hypothetical protein CEE37_02465 [candidate division LCP-89 bacterium B3_LCP]|uniref:Uncharacterized protein n=1 Tax=candidate division LCP-89 bacterium B3_LCP TaxID=2012998 RepID=A0A532V614_UNCL8|nr:MAG: hypothetical protein CEE37_02465 [candidate division LCP-89 bacterium B3_LCP]